MANTEATLFGRRARLTLSLPSGSFSETDATQNTMVIEGGDDPDNPGLRIVFKVVKTDQKEPNTAEVSVYNLSASSRAKLKQKGVRLVLEAGYAGTGIAQLFVGDTRTTDHVREGADFKTLLKAGDAERSIRYARASLSFARGATVADVVKGCTAAMGLALGNTTSQLPKLSKVLYQGWTAHGAASSELERILATVGYGYSVQDGSVQILAPGEALTLAIPDVTPQSGLIGSPEMGAPEKKGKAPSLHYRELLRPQARPGGRAHVKSERYDGIFRSRKVTHDGDTRGGNWYTDHEAVQDTTVTLA